MIALCRLLLVTATCLFAANVFSNEWRGLVEAEYQRFYESALDYDQHQSYFSVAIEPEWYHSWANDRQSLVIKPFYRWDQHDHQRTHGDMRELYWSYLGAEYEIYAGVRKVFWGATESQHLVDILNQTDLVEDLDAEEKLGQPMLSASIIRDWGVAGFYLMPYFRERPFPGEEGRLRTMPRIDTDQAAIYESGKKEKHLDWALRWSDTIGYWDLGVSYFRGTQREPSLVSGLDGQGSPVFIPFYGLMNQSALDLQGVTGAWLWKLEALYRDTGPKDYFASVGGFEYTFYHVSNSMVDLGVVLEYSYDDRGKAATTEFDDDLMIGLRLAANDEQSTECLFGLIWDREGHGRIYRIEASRRLTNHLKLNIEGASFKALTVINPLYSYRQDDFIQVALAYYF